MITIEQMRRKLMFDCPKYRSVGWQNKVSNMRPAQIIAIYNKFKQNGYFDKVKTKKTKSEEGECYQMTIFDYLMEDDLK